ncbi:MAG: hypothetical protein ACFB8W_09135 [Elainellaceae cyanobacterium]
MGFLLRAVYPFFVAGDRVIRLVGEHHQGDDAAILPAAEQAVTVGDRNAQQGAVELEALAVQGGWRGAPFQCR